MPGEFWYVLGGLAVLAALCMICVIRRRKLLKRIKERGSDEKLREIDRELLGAGFAYDYNQDIFYGRMDAWQRDAGYCKIYDEAAYMAGMEYDCEPITFTYGEKRWLIEFWKGQYGMCTGAEVGIFCTQEEDIFVPGEFQGTFYKSVSDEDRLYIAYYLKRRGEVLCYQKGLHWRLSAFKLGMFSEPSELTMDIKITFPDAGMCEAFQEALFEAGYTQSEIVAGYRTMFVKFRQPHTRQPVTRTVEGARVTQRHNRLYVRAYRYLTRNYSWTPDKLCYLKAFLPNVFRTVIRLGQGRERYREYANIRFYQNGE